MVSQTKIGFRIHVENVEKQKKKKKKKKKVCNRTYVHFFNPSTLCENRTSPVSHTEENQESHNHPSLGFPLPV
jgi:hypothetical protein